MSVLRILVLGLACALLWLSLLLGLPSTALGRAGIGLLRWARP